MTNDNKFKPTNQHFKELRNIPKTETRIVLNDWSQPVKKSSLSALARSKVVNRSGSNYVSESGGYGPCSYSGCPYDTPFNLSISIEGQSRNWARYSDSDTFPGYWNYSPHKFLGDYYWREDLWLNRIDRARTAIDYMNSDSLYVVNAAGLFCVENGKFCNNAKDILNKCISHHERGNRVKESEIISSDLHKYAKWTAKTVAIVAATAANPVGAVAVGGTLWGAGKAMEHHPDANEYDKNVFRSISGFGGDMAKSGFLGWVGGEADKVADGFKNLSGNQKGFCEWGEIADKAVSKVSDYRYVKFAKEVGSSGMEATAKHEYHRANGRYYDSDCPICSA